MIASSRESRAQALVLLIPAALLGGAYIGQYVFGLYPCEMCWWQRYPHFIALGLALLSFVAPPRRVWVALAAGSIIASGLIGAYHAGVEYGWWAGETACTAAAIGGGNPLDSIMNAPMIRCDEVQWSLFGISLAGYNFLISTFGGALAFWLLGLKKKTA
ncbi:disulfide bond formation protein B [Tsuneonella mangrovi]|uniref:disulfide bond formation protein B n=1 Tax=Tsuneonella mangrovi TaxID=1982042 RepID=UPI000BA2418D|nr:disulfide bond formation protein B [Tsuneonella mangrovi]